MSDAADRTHAIVVVVLLAVASASAHAASHADSAASTQSGKAIIGGDLQKSRTAGKAIIGGDANGIPAGILASGPIEKVDLKSGRVVILGQTYAAQAGAPALKRLADQVSSGSTVVASVLGSKDSAGKLRAARLVVGGTDYAPGATPVVVLGRVESVQSGTGTLRVGQLSVDYTSILSNASTAFVAGQLIAVAGVQAAAGASLVASRIVVLE